MFSSQSFVNISMGARTGVLNVAGAMALLVGCLVPAQNKVDKTVWSVLKGESLPGTNQRFPKVMT